ncbi:TetR/AcrR family transcriptional regulator [Dietzia sp. PP-33]|jgi:AcrR family transcriptional regulator|uniref:TetR/AcrR family transcriptional regulator n=1 Tax=Dietzia sp. PP-33 TaxID=2957500 RepID=UPI0029BD6566|nr:TetR/AcrR family transcriptional regulator [Dietzia sp. PP-33]MDX2356631.1 TetR/AcrR family transcriptional regulator [Dietzia sp. PP-33]
MTGSTADRDVAGPGGGDLTARARIRHAALALYAEFGEDRVSMRRVAAEVGVTIGLIQHHFGTKEGLRRAVDDLVVERVVGALATVEHTGTAAEVVEARNVAVREMLRKNPQVVRYLNRALLETDGRGAPLLEAIVELTTREVEGLRRGGLASTRTSDKVQVVRTLVDQVGELFLQPVVEAIWAHIGGDPDRRPSIRITVEAG